MRAYPNIVFTTIATVSLGGCGGVYVSNSQGNLNGIPFYVKTPQCIQETSISESWINVSVKATNLKDASKSRTIPEKGFILMPDSESNRYAIDTELGERKYLQLGPEDSNQDLSFGPLMKFLNDLRSDTKDLKFDVLKNSWSTILTVTAKDTYYITTRAPLFGTVTGNITLSPENTLSTVNTTVTDETAKTLLAAIPVKEYLTARLLPPSVPKSLKDPIKYPSPPKKIEWDYAATIQQVRYVTDLKKIVDTSKACESIDNRSLPPLSLNDAKGAKDGTQLMARKLVGGDSKPEAEDKNALQVKGTITLPDSLKK